MLIYWKKEFERVVSDLVNGKKSLFLQVRIYTPHEGRLFVYLLQSCMYIVTSMEKARKRYVK